MIVCASQDVGKRYVMLHVNVHVSILFILKCIVSTSFAFGDERVPSMGKDLTSYTHPRKEKNVSSSTKKTWSIWAYAHPLLHSFMRVCWEDKTNTRWLNGRLNGLVPIYTVYIATWRNLDEHWYTTFVRTMLVVISHFVTQSNAKSTAK